MKRVQWNNQILLPKHLVTELIESLLRKANKHPEFQKSWWELDKNIIHQVAKIVKKKGSSMRNLHRGQKNS